MAARSFLLKHEVAKVFMWIPCELVIRLMENLHVIHPSTWPRVAKMKDHESSSVEHFQRGGDQHSKAVMYAKRITLVASGNEIMHLLFHTSRTLFPHYYYSSPRLSHCLYSRLEATSAAFSPFQRKRRHDLLLGSFFNLTSF